MNQQITLGRIVMYGQGSPLLMTAAIVAGVYEETSAGAVVSANGAADLPTSSIADLVLFTWAGILTEVGVPFSAVPSVGHWSWPARTPVPG